VYFSSSRRHVVAFLTVILRIHINVALGQTIFPTPAAQQAVTEDFLKSHGTAK
jgi:nucleoside permease NupC